MKKSLVALAVMGAFAGAASAQSSVTLYGIVDVNYQMTDPKRDGAQSTSGINGGHQAGNRWGVRGSEALGGGLNAVFALESGFDIDRGTSAQGGRLFGRQAWAGLSGGFGTIVAGRVATFSSGTGSYDMFSDIDPFLTGHGIATLGSTFSSANSLRVDNAILYRTPNISGFQAGAGYSFNVDGAEAAGSSNNNRLIFTGLRYAGGPLVIALTYDIVKLSTAVAPGAEDQKHLQVGGIFDLKFLKIHAAYAKEDNVRVATAATAATNGADADAWMVGLTAPVGPGLVRASYQTRDGDALGGVERDAKVWALGYMYSLSRRTDLYVTYADRKGEKSIVEGPAANDAFNQTQFTLGVNHRF